MNAARDAMKFLSDEHSLLRELFGECERGQYDPPRRPEHIVAEIFSVFRLHAQLEEELFYSAVAKALWDSRQKEFFLRDAELANAAIAAEMNRLEAMEPGDPEFAIRFAHFASSVRRHMDEEEALFSALDRSRVDFVQLGVEMAARRVRLAVADGIASPGDTEAVEEGEGESTAGDRIAFLRRSVPPRSRAY
jgi:hypothetical protein